MRRILVSTVLTSCVLTLGTASVAFAHAEISPAEAPAGSTQEYSLEVLQEKDVPTTGVEMVVPEGFEVSHADAPEGWEVSDQGGSVTWSGGQISPDEEAAEFPFEATAPGEGGEYAFEVLQSYEDGSVVEWTGGADSESPAAFVSVSAEGGAAGHEAEPHGHGAEGDLPETGGIEPSLLYGVAGLTGLALVLSGLALRPALRAALRRRS